jgi:hypothetical protein
MLGIAGLESATAASARSARISPCSRTIELHVVGKEPEERFLPHHVSAPQPLTAGRVYWTL